jgi:hypothetical protein
MRMIFVDSRDRVSGTSTNFSIQLPETLHVEGAGHRARIDQLRIPLSTPTIETGDNDTIQVLVGATIYTLTIPMANYDGPTLAMTIQGLLNATAPGAWTVSYATNKIAMTMSCSNNFTIVGGSYAAQLMSHPYTSTANSYSFTYVSVLGIDMFFLSSSKFSTLDTFGPANAHDTLMCAPVTSAFGSILVADMPYNTWFNVPANLTTQQLDFQIRDRWYDVLSNLVPNISFLLTID